MCVCVCVCVQVCVNISLTPIIALDFLGHIYPRSSRFRYNL